MSRQFPALRGVAISLVVLHHSIVLGLEALQKMGYPLPAGLEHILLLILQELGIFAVPIFLFLSGSFFVYAARVQNETVPYKVVWAGLKNILWPYFVWSILFYIMIYFLHDQKYTMLEYAKSLIVGYPFNFVPLIVFYYLLSPIIIRLSKSYAWVVLLGIGFYQLFSLTVIVPGILGFTFPNWVRYLTPPVLRNTIAVWGIYFPAGVVFSLNSKAILPTLRKYWWAFAAIALAFFVPAVLNEAAILFFPIASHVAPLAFIFLLPVMRRETIPWVRQFEKIGKKAYGLYLTHLLLIDFVLVGVQLIAPGLIHFQLVLALGSFIIALIVPLWIMGGIERIPRPNVYRYVFG